MENATPKREQMIMMRKSLFTLGLLCGLALALTACSLDGSLKSLREKARTDSNDSVGNPVYTVTFDSNGGTAVTAQTGVAEGSKITAPPGPAKEGNIFGGWYKDNSTLMHGFSI